jgi:nucleotide-binding universal stress UspA family protein
MRILLATDGSEEARAAMNWLMTFPLPRSATVRVLAVTTLSAPPGDMAADEYADTIRERARLIVSEARDVLVNRWADVQERVRDGDAREAIVQAAEEWPADLIVVGARGLSGLKRALVGSVSASVVRYAPCPVLVVKGRCHTLHTVVIGVDGSPEAARAVAFVNALPLEPATVVRLVTAVTPPLFIGDEQPRLPSRLDRLVVQREIDAEHMLGYVAKGLRRIVSVQRRVTIGHAGEAIADAAGEPDVDLVVVGARGLGTFGRLLLGSTSEYVLNHADCPILVIRGRS